MSEDAIRAVYVHSRATHGALACLLTIARRHNPAHPEFIAWPSEETLRRHLHCSKRTVQRYLRELRQLGELVSDKRGRTNFYTICLPHTSDEEYSALLTSQATTLSPIDEDVPIGDNPVAYIGDNPVAYHAQQATKMDRIGDNPVAPIKIDINQNDKKGDKNSAAPLPQKDLMSNDRWRQVVERVILREHLSPTLLAEFKRARLELYPVEGYALVIAPNDRYKPRFEDLLDLHLPAITQRHWELIILTESELRRAERQEESNHATLQ